MNWKLVLAILTCNILFMSSSYTMLIPFLPMYLTMELGVSDADVNLWSGIVFSATFLVSAVMAPIWGRMADTKGKRLMAMRASFLLAISYFLGGIVETPGQLTLMRLFQGFASGLWPMDLAIMTLYAPPKKIGFCLGVMQGTLTAGGVVGPLLGGVLAEAVGMRYSFFLAAAALFTNFLIFAFIIKEPPVAKKAAATEEVPEDNVSPWHMPLLRNMLLCGTLVQMVILILQPVLTTYITKLAGPLPNIVFVAGFVFSLGGIAGAIAAPFWGTFGQRRGFFRAMCLGMAGAGLSMIIQGIPTRSCHLPSCSSSVASSSAASTLPSTPCSPTTRRRPTRGASLACCLPHSRSARWQAPCSAASSRPSSASTGSSPSPASCCSA